MIIINTLRCVFLALTAFCTVLGGTVHASVLILDTVTGNAATPGDSLNSSSAATYGLVRTGSSNVQIDQFGIYGQLIPNGVATSANVRWSVFTASGTSIYDSGPLAVSGSASSTWFDSPVFSTALTLQANSDYYIGLITDASFWIRYFGSASTPDAVDILGNGLRSPGGNFPGSNGKVENFTNPMLTRTDLTVQVGERVFAPDNAVLPQPVPLPAAAWLLGSGLLALAGASARRRGHLPIAGPR